MDRISYTLGRDLEPPVPGTPGPCWSGQLRGPFLPGSSMAGRPAALLGVLWGVLPVPGPVVFPCGMLQAQAVPTWFLWEFTVQ